MRLTKKISFVGIIFVLTFSSAVGLFKPAKAAQLITFRSVDISSAVPGANINEAFSFSLVSTSSLGSIVFEHCSNSPLPGVACVAPAGYSSSSRNLSAQTGNIGFSIDNANSTVNKIVITRTPSAGVLGTTTYNFTNITNTNMPGTTIYVRIATYASTDGTGVAIDAGSMAYATQSGFSIGAYVPRATHRVQVAKEWRYFDTRTRALSPQSHPL